MISLFWLNSTTDAGQYPWPGGSLAIPRTSRRRLSPCLSFVSHKRSNLQGVGQELVHLGDLGRDREVDGPVSDLNNQAADDVRVDLFMSAYSSIPGVCPVLLHTSLVTLSFLPWPT